MVDLLACTKSVVGDDSGLMHVAAEIDDGVYVTYVVQYQATQYR